MSTLFISHRSHDRIVAAELSRQLAANQYNPVFLDFDPKVGIPTGRNWERELYARLRACRAVILLWGDRSPESHWCLAEISHARALGKLVLPVKIGLEEVPALVKDVQVLDMSEQLRGQAPDGACRADFSRLIADLKRNQIAPGPGSVWDGTRPPYPGLLFFEEEDAAVFFGRDREIRQCLEALTKVHTFGGTRCLVVLGASGSGKSSLVRAGLVPRLRPSSAWVVVEPFRPGLRPFDAFASAVAASFERYGKSRPWQELRATLEHSASPDGADRGPLLDWAQDLRNAAGRREAHVLVVVDQLEEALNAGPEPGHEGRGSGEECRRFLTVLQSLVESTDRSLVLLCTLRSDFLGSLQGSPALREMDFVPLPVGPFSPEEVREIIQGARGPGRR